MKNASDARMSEEYYTAEMVDDIFVLRMKQCLFRHCIEIDAKQKLIKLLDQVSTDPVINVVVIIGEQSTRGISYYYKICDDHNCSDKDQFHFTRFQYAVSDITLQIARMNKFVIYVDHRKKIPLFLNLAFACDYRIFQQDFSLYNPYLESNITPRGGEVFFIARLLGYRKTMGLFLEGKYCSADDAMKNGLVDDVAAPNEIEKRALDRAKTFARKPPYLIGAVKGLLNYSLRNLDDCLDIENKTHTYLRNKGCINSLECHSSF